MTRLWAAILLVLAGCAAEPSQLQRLGDVEPDNHRWAGPLGIYIFSTIVLFAGCSTIGIPKLMDDRLIEQIQVKQTTQQEVLQWLGAPTTVSPKLA